MARHPALTAADPRRTARDPAGGPLRTCWPRYHRAHDRPPAGARSGGAARVPDHALRAGLVAGAAYVLVGWRALLVPSLIRFVAPAFGQADAGMGAYYLATALAYGVGALFGGRLHPPVRCPRDPPRRRRG